MLIDRLRRAMQHAGELPSTVQEDLAEQIEELLAYPPVPPESFTISDLIGDDGSDAFFNTMMDTLDELGYRVPPTPLIEDV